MKKYLLYLFPLLIQLFSTTANAQNIYRLNNKFKTSKFDKLYKQNKDGTFPATSKKIATSLKGFIVKPSEDRDTLFIKFWDINAKTDPSIHVTGTVNSDDNDATFAYEIDWKNNRHFTVPFSATTVTATSIPFRYRLKSNADLEADFLNVGVNLFFVRGVTRFFKQEQIDARQNYWGWGPFVAFSQQKIDSANTDGQVTAEKQIATISYGISGIRSWNGFSIIMAIGFDNAIGSNAKYWEDNNLRHGLKPWIGFGFGFKLTDFAFKTTNDSK